MFMRVRIRLLAGSIGGLQLTIPTALYVVAA